MQNDNELKLVPEENNLIYRYLYYIETGLREFIIDRLKARDGETWYKRRLPGDLLDKYKASVKFERNAKWTNLIPHHPIYYIDFADLRKIIEKSDNWAEEFKLTFGSREIVSGLFAQMEYIRNRIAHNRLASENDVTLVKAAFNILTEAIGKKEFQNYVSQCTCATDIEKRLMQLIDLAELCIQDCKMYKKVTDISYWYDVQKEWWFDKDYLSNDLDAIFIFFASIEEYRSLPRIRGEGHKIEAWINTNDIYDKHHKAKDRLTEIAHQWR